MPPHSRQATQPPGTTVTRPVLEGHESLAGHRWIPASTTVRDCGVFSLHSHFTIITTVWASDSLWPLTTSALAVLTVVGVS